MLYQQYKRNSWVGKIYHWYHGYYPDNTSCGVRRTVLFSPLKLVFYPRVGQREYPLLFLYLFAFQLYCLTWWRYIAGDLSFRGLASVAAWFILFFEIALVIVYAAKFIAEHVHIKINTPKLVGKAGHWAYDQLDAGVELIGGWWHDFYHRVCKPVRWTE